MTKGFWVKMESAREILAYRSADWQMMIIPSLMGDNVYHVIIERVGENGVLVNRLMWKNEIDDAYGIQV
jgi:hypothetical protein